MEQINITWEDLSQMLLDACRSGEITAKQAEDLSTHIKGIHDGNTRIENAQHDAVEITF